MLTGPRETCNREVCPAKGATIWSTRRPRRNSTSSYYRARYYDPSTARFISEDPIRFSGGTNFYTYTGNDPMDWLDPLGLDWIRYNGQKLSVYGGKLGDTSQLLDECAATSGFPGFQYPQAQNQENGPLPEGRYRINLSLDPTRYTKLIKYGNVYTTAPGVGVEWIGPGSDDWGTWRARLEKVSVHSTRDNFYLHTSHKGYTHGCA